MKNMPLMLPIITAYIPASGSAFFTPQSLQGTTDWMLTTRYDIDAKVGEDKLSAWQDPVEQAVMLRTMLQAMLAERFKLTVHRDMKEVPTYSLVLGKSKLKLQESVPGEAHPAGNRLPGSSAVMVPEDGAQKIHFYGASMVELASLLSNIAKRPVEDKTGLTGLYNFVIQRPAEMNPGAPTPVEGAASDPAPTIFTVLGDLGLKLLPVKGSVETLVIDHIEKPSEN